MNTVIVVWDRFLLAAFIISLWGSLTWYFYRHMFRDEEGYLAIVHSALYVAIFLMGICTFGMLPVMLSSWIIFSDSDPQRFIEFLMRVYPL